MTRVTDVTVPEPRDRVGGEHPLLRYVPGGVLLRLVTVSGACQGLKMP